MSAKNCLGSVSAAVWDLDNSVAVLRGLARGETPCKRPQAMVLEYIDSATEALAEARKAALNLPKGDAS